MSDETNEDMPARLFEDPPVVFTVIASSDLPDLERRNVIAELEKSGATYVQPDIATGRPANFNGLTHIFSATADFPGYDDAVAAFIHVARPVWVHQCLEKGKQVNPRQFSPDPNLIMSDIVVACADLPEGDIEAIAGGVLAMGGQYTAPLTKIVTHLFALSIDDDRCQLAIKKNLKCKMVLPHWFDDCLRLGKKISERPYMIPDPEILRPQNAPPRPAMSEDVKGATSHMPSELPPTPQGTSESPRQLDIFNNRAIKLGEDLHLSTNLRRTLDDLIVAGGGRLVDDVDQADVYICQYRSGPSYVRASQANKDVGNLSWLYHLITYNKWTSPMRRLLHYPIPRDGVPGFKNMAISVSNYTGDTRVYLENLIKACGANFTKTMRQDNTHLITAHTKGEKCDAAREWGVSVVNHLWLEESYAKYKMADLSVNKYTHFPPRTHLGEICGQTMLERKTLEDIFFPPVKEVKAKAPKPTSTAKKPQRRDPVPQSSEDEDEPLDDTVPLQEVDNMQIDDNMDQNVQPPTTVQKAKRGRSDASNMTPALRKFVDSGKENETPGSTGSRGAKNRAMSKLHDAAADIELFNKEMKRKGGVTHGRERGSATPEPKAAKGRKRKSKEAEDEDEDAEGEAAESSARKAKKSKAGKNPPVARRMILTGYQRWVDNPKLEQQERNQLRNLGILITDDTAHVDLLCAPKIVRTKKFICALADGPEIVASSFLDYCLKHKEVPDPADHYLRDKLTEETLGITLKESLEQAKANSHHLLQNWQIFCTEDVTGGFETFKFIVEANGGTCMLYKGRTAMNVTKRAFANDDVAAESQGDDEGDTLYLISGGTAKEKELWPRFGEMAKKAKMVPVVVKTDWLLSVCMRHVVHWNDKWKWEGSDK
ncbi:BRCT domain-containing protein [Tothia fuscella]|uniref:BRCT domain-containing protein n=1 Tax=Tothia fuscella TaxID=1048955 RepID=A0A9P4NNR7_9PEZI|nr:BRCT domain-containing protein [Tothia fuscella]